MRQILVFFSILNISLTYGQNKVLDTLVDIGGYNMHFYIIKGEGTPILFESGGGNDGSVWETTAKDVHDITGTTVIYYDRSGFGKSELNPNHKNDEEFGIENGITELETSLKKLGYFKDLIIVSHSYGGIYSTLFTSKNINKVLYNVRVDASLGGQYTEGILKRLVQMNPIQEMKDKHLGMYYLGVNFPNTIIRIWEVKYPKIVPAIDIISLVKNYQTDDEWQIRNKAHENFVNEESNRIGIIAYGSNHTIYDDNPGLVLNAIVKAYVYTLNDDNKKLEILSKSVDKSIELFIQLKIGEKE